MADHLPATDTGDSPEALRGRLMAMIETGMSGTRGRLPGERDLSAALGVGRRAVRRALDLIEAEGLIWRHRGKGTFAGQPPDPTQVLAAGIAGETNALEVMEARLCIEPALAALCAARASPADIDRMRALARRVVEATDPQSTELWDGSFHRLIARTAANRPLLTAFSMIDEIRSSQSWRDLRSRARNARTLAVTDREHQAIIDSIAAGDPAAADAAMRAHLTTLAGNIERLRTPSAGEARHGSPP